MPWKPVSVNMTKWEKLASKWLGPYTIMEVHKNGNYTMADANG